MNSVNLKIIVFACLLSVLTGCNKSKDINIPLPAYKSELVVECYLEPGQPFRLLLTESVSYFDAPSIPEVADAIVTISFGGETVALNHIPLLPNAVDTAKYFNFKSDKIVPTIYNEPFVLSISDKKGRNINATAMILPPPAIDSVYYVFETEDSLGYTLLEIKDKAEKLDYYRFMLLESQGSKTNLLQDIYFDQNLTSTSPYLIKLGDKILIKSKNEIKKFAEKNEKQFLKLYQIEGAFFNFLRSASDSKNANGNPFAQPTSIKSNVSGGIGIFTGISSTTINLEIPEDLK